MRRLHVRLLVYGVAMITDTLTTWSRVQVRITPRVRVIWDDAYILRLLAIIEAAPVPAARKYHALDRLYFKTTNRHPHGFAADVLESIARAMDKY
jgi:hypothetical protein